MNEISILDSLIASFIGIALVFAVLAILIVAIKLMSAIVKKLESKKSSPSSDASCEEQSGVRLAKGSCGGIKLYDVPDRTAAMIMAITADKLDLPLNQIRFISIREINGEEKVTK